MTSARSLALLPLFLFLPGAGALAQRTDTARVAVAPQVELLTIIHHPAGDGPHPVVLLRNPYRTRGGAMTWLAERLVPHGYAVVEQDVRGTGGSPGRFVPFMYDVQDGTATLDWLTAQPWAGRVGLWGISYLGWAAYAVAETGHPGVDAMVLGSAWADMAPFLAPGGAFNLMANVAWLRGFAGGGGIPPQAALDSLFRTLPVASLLGPMAGLTAAERPFRWEALRMPVLHFTGWYDNIYRESLRGYEALSAAPGPVAAQRLIVGPWAHNGELSGATRVADVDFGPRAAAGIDSVAAWTRRFFDAFLRGLPEVDPQVRVFVMGENAWHDHDAWPPTAAAARAWYLAADGRLEPHAGDGAGTATFRYDPEDPMPTLGGVNSHLFPRNLGPFDQSPLDGRGDAARFIAAALDRPLVLAGPLRAILHLEADAPATDVAVKLISVTPDGAARLIEDGIRRIPRLAAGVTEVTVELGQRALRLEPGTRLRLDVTGGNFPKYDRNPNTGEDPITATALRPVTITLHHGGARPSRLELVALRD
jgi:uncharacterized protein